MEIIASEIHFEWITYIALTFPKLMSLRASILGYGPRQTRGTLGGTRF